MHNKVFGASESVIYFNKMLNLPLKRSANQHDHALPLSTMLTTTLFCPKGLKGKDEKGDLDEGHLKIGHKLRTNMLVMDGQGPRILKFSILY